MAKRESLSFHRCAGYLSVGRRVLGHHRHAIEADRVIYACHETPYFTEGRKGEEKRLLGLFYGQSVLPTPDASSTYCTIPYIPLTAWVGIEFSREFYSI